MAPDCRAPVPVAACLDPYVVDALVASHLMQYLSAFSDQVQRGVQEPDDDLVDALLRVIEEFTTAEQFEQFMAEAG